MRQAKTQISLCIRPVWSESSLSAWRKFGALATLWAHSEDFDETGRMSRLIWVFAGRTVGFVMSRLIFIFSHFHSHTQVQLLFDDVRVSQNTQNNAWSRDWMFLWMEFLTRVYYGTNFFKWKITESFNNDVYFEYLSTLVIYFGRYNALDIESIINQIPKEYVKRNKGLYMTSRRVNIFKIEENLSIFCIIIIYFEIIKTVILRLLFQKLFWL